MKKYIFLLLLCFSNSFLFSQNSVLNDTIKSNIIVNFNKVKLSVKDANSAKMEVSHIQNSRNAIVKFNVPSFWYRSNTSLDDYCIINIGDNKVKLNNQVSEKATGVSKNIYSFTFVITKDSLNSILSKKIKNITFYFTPNDNIEKDLLATGNKLNKFDKHLIKLSKKTLNFKVSKPDIIELSKLNNWLKSL